MAQQWRRKSTSDFGFSDGTRLGMYKSICRPNLDKVIDYGTQRYGDAFTPRDIKQLLN